MVVMAVSPVTAIVSRMCGSTVRDAPTISFVLASIGLLLTVLPRSYVPTDIINSMQALAGHGQILGRNIIRYDKYKTYKVRGTELSFEHLSFFSLLFPQRD